MVKWLPTMRETGVQSLARESPGEEMAPHSSTLAWKIPWMEEPGKLQSMGLRRVGHDWATSLSLFTFVHWRRKWQPTPVLLPGESHGRRSLVSYSPWGRKELDMTEWLTLSFSRTHTLSQSLEPTIWVNNNAELWITQNNLLLLSHLKISTYSKSISLHLAKPRVSIRPN